jgi:hypothetical protein
VAVVVDTNVAVVAEGLADHADDACVTACEDRLIAIRRAGGLLLDQDDAIVEEYVKRLGHAGQPGIGRAFVKWAHDHRFDARACRQVAITRRGEGWRRYEEFPAREELRYFDPDDQKFAAVAIASGDDPPIVNATDRDWWEHRESLEDGGIRVEFLCPQHMGGRA